MRVDTTGEVPQVRLSDLVERLVMEHVRPLVRGSNYAWLIGALSLLVAACGGSIADAPSARATEAAAPTSAATSEVFSFRYELVIELTGGSSPFAFEQRGEVVLPDREHATQSYEVSWLSQETERVAIGEQVWLRGDLPWVDLGASPLGVIGRGGASGAAFDGMTGSGEDLGGHATTRYELSGDAFVLLAGAPGGAFDESTTVTIWVSDEYGVPLQMQMSAANADGELSLSLRVTDINAADIAVSRPASAQTANLESEAQR